MKVDSLMPKCNCVEVDGVKDHGMVCDIFPKNRHCWTCSRLTASNSIILHFLRCKLGLKPRFHCPHWILRRSLR